MNTELPLRDIHLPDTISWWPPAPGWWISGVVIITITILIFRWYRRHAKKRALHRSAWHELQRIKSRYEQGQDAQRLSQELSILLRRVSITITPREEAAGLTGDDWLIFLDSLADKSIFNSESGRQLITAPYQPAHVIDGQSLINLSEQWLNIIRKQPRAAHA